MLVDVSRFAFPPAWSENETTPLPLSLPTIRAPSDDPDCGCGVWALAVYRPGADYLVRVWLGRAVSADDKRIAGRIVRTLRFTERP